MATYKVPVMGANTIPDTSGSVWFEPYSIKATNDRWPIMVCIFADNASRLGLRGMFRVPDNYAASPRIFTEWTSTATSGSCVWDFEYRAVADGESMDQSSQNESVSVTQGAPGSVNLRRSASTALTASLFAAGDLVEYELYRDGSDGSDTMAAVAILFGTYFGYSDT